MRLLPLGLLFLLTACASSPPPEPAAAAPASKHAIVQPSEHTGTIAGAPWRLDVPEQWNGELVVYFHGYAPQEQPIPEVMPRNGYEGWLLEQGFAIAQSEYSARGWSVAEALVDSEAMRKHVVGLLGQPKRTWAMGHSMGAHIVLGTLETQGAAYDGGLALCGANAPAEELFNGPVLGPLAVFARQHPGVLAPGGLFDADTPRWPDAAKIEAALVADEAFASRFGQAFGIPREGMAGGLMLRFAVLHELAERAGGVPVDNTKVTYSGFGDDAAVNAGVRRYTGDSAAMAYANARLRLTGATARPVVLMANETDEVIPSQTSSRYANLARNAGRGDQVFELSPVGNGHCRFGPEAESAALAKLRAWVIDGQHPGKTPG
jgi:alpha-beta hydrolase superfamily lysophospholipase